MLAGFSSKYSIIFPIESYIYVLAKFINCLVLIIMRTTSDDNRLVVLVPWAIMAETKLCSQLFRQPAVVLMLVICAL